MKIISTLSRFYKTISSAGSHEADITPVLETIATRIKIPFTVVDADGVIQFASSAFIELLSLSASRLKGLNIIDLFIPKERERLNRELKDRTVNPDQTSSLSLTGLTRDGRQLSLYASISFIKTSRVHFLLTFEDKTEAQKEQVKIEKLEHQAAIGTFTSGVAHEFNNVLAGIRGYAQLAKNDLKDTALVIKAFTIIEQETVRGAELCKNLSLYTGNNKLSTESVILSEIIEAAADLQNRYLASDKVTLTTDIDDIPPLLADRYKLQQVILNLIINARHAVIPKGSGSILITAKITGNEICITVSDDGIGIEPHNLTKIFDPFYSNKIPPSGSAVLKSNIRGSGLGLSVCQAIIKLHGGSIDVASQPGIGSTFTVRFPFHLAERRGLEVRSEADNMHKIRTPRKLSILVVDDEMPIREILFRSLTRTSAEVTLATDAEECLSLIELNRYDLILLDYILPEMNADRLLPIIREKNPSAKVIFISGWGASPLKKASLEKQADGWIDKPFNMDAIIQKIDSLF